ncbi:MAG: o-succinylbenzoate synthase [Acidimicrobiales bacterium]
MVEGGPVPSLVRRWRELGSDGQVRLESVDLWMLELPFVETVTTATHQHRRRPLVIVRLVASSGNGPIEGWGECAALAESRYDPEDVHRSFDTLEGTLLPSLEVGFGTARSLPELAALDGLRQAVPEAPMAFATLEMAVADAHLRAQGRSLAALLGVESRTVPIGAVLGLMPSEGALVDRVTSLAEQGFSRVKLKIRPGWDMSPLEAVSRALPSMRLQVDANGSYSKDDLDQLAELDRFRLLCLEQPFDPHDSDDPDGLTAHARLAACIRTPICLDESVRSRQDIAHALALGSCSVVCLKPARLGGLGQALAEVERCAADGTPLWMGGMFESGYARGVNRTLAALPGFSWPGDLSPARTYLAADLVAPPELTRAGETAELEACLPLGPGMGEPPRFDVVTRLAVRHALIVPP